MTDNIKVIIYGDMTIVVMTVDEYNLQYKYIIDTGYHKYYKALFCYHLLCGYATLEREIIGRDFSESARLSYLEDMSTSFSPYIHTRDASTPEAWEREKLTEIQFLAYVVDHIDDCLKKIPFKESNEYIEEVLATFCSLTYYTYDFQIKE